ncbi:hypothetical protein K435DRAFT_777773 [Dendrothele bispora CBS 962.96]|uniref:Amidohydrolase 3 domain-containing protein n=1 Tax=Dendrothele bispora (strain CBS 962.96) TaxID=1314807 RepID=A0A4S8M746_DENBC|nr:hypothetical protein K435DRAFT_777773 [Dendrothele bispora CBS 962.96]
MAKTTKKASGPGPTTPKSNSGSTNQSTSYYMTWQHVLARLAPLILLSIYQWARSSNRYTICSMTGSIYTVDKERPQVHCISIQGAHIAGTGTLDELHPPLAESFSYPLGLDWVLRPVYKFLYRVPEVKYINSNSVIVPGLADAHAHIIENGFKMQLQLDTAKSVAEVIERTKAYILAHPDVHHNNSRWIEGMGWDQTKWPEAKFPNAADFDKEPLLRDRFIALRRVDGHATWVSPAVLKLMGDLPDEVEGGEVIRDSKGKPTGVFLDNAISLIPIPAWTENQMAEFFDTTMKQALSYGLTSIHDADSSPAMISFFKKQADENNIPMHLYLMGNVLSDTYWGDKIPRLINYGKAGRVTVRSIKLYTDGALGSWGAALLEPYSDKPDTKGILRSNPDALSKLVKQFHKDGWQVNIHCIGDRANNVILNIFEDIIQGKEDGSIPVNVTEWRPRIEHAQIMTPQDLERIGKLGVIPSVQPTHATSDMWYAESRLGSERIKGAYAYQTLLNGSMHGILPLGSDFPVEGVNPLLGFYASVSRLSVDGKSPHGEKGWYTNEALSRTQALKGMTLDAAFASFTENVRGSLVPGKLADFVVLDRDIMTVPLPDILKAKVTATVVEGQVMYGAL